MISQVCDVNTRLICFQLTDDPKAFSKLYMQKIHSLDSIISEGTLYAFDLPLQLNSPWWGRSAAMLPWFWLVCVIIRRIFFPRSVRH